MSKVAPITGITRQDGSYFAELLLSKGYEVHGLIRRASTFNTVRIDHLNGDPHDQGTRHRLHHGDLGGARLVTLLNYPRSSRRPPRGPNDNCSPVDGAQVAYAWFRESIDSLREWVR